ncbi:MAG: hypothetical protein M1570_04040 [Chloroflexi bacterium]|nr:hypothetical protein [Chloroflexota bacterium]
MKSFQRILRIFIMIGSLSGFLGGWALLAHAGKPAPVEAAPVDVAPLATPAPLNFNNSSQLQPLPPLQPMPQFSMPTLRTRGS